MSTDRPQRQGSTRPSAAPHSAGDDERAFDPALSGAIDHARLQLEAVEQAGGSELVCNAWCRVVDRLEARLPAGVGEPVR